MEGATGHGTIKSSKLEQVVIVNSGFFGQGLLIQLRAHYPTGCLLSELLQVVDGNYVVRATLEVDGMLIASALAAAKAIDVAEDQARMRLMTIVGLTPLGLTEANRESTAARIPDIAPPPPGAPAAIEPPMAVVDAASRAVDLPSTDADTGVVSTLPKAAVKPTKSKAKSTKPKSIPKVEVPPPPEPVAEMTGGADSEADLEIEYEFTMDGEVLASSADDAAMPVEPAIDLSDVIAQIGAEIERIGWTKKQGSAYLQETYGKRTRAELTEDELLSFLHYLKALPSKVQPSLNELPF